MAGKRRIFNASCKAKVALEAIKGHRTISELAAKHKLHATQINLWKKQLLEGAEEVFENAGGQKLKVVIQSLGKSPFSSEEILRWCDEMMIADRVGFIADDELKSLRGQFAK